MGRNSNALATRVLRSSVAGLSLETAMPIRSACAISRSTVLPLKDDSGAVKMRCRGFCLCAVEIGDHRLELIRGPEHRNAAQHGAGLGRRNVEKATGQ